MFPQGSQSHRAKDFKSNLGDTNDVVKRHADKAQSLRREKRDEKIQRMRNRETKSETMPDRFLENALAARDAFLRTASLESLQFIQKFLRTMDDEDINHLLDDKGALASHMVLLLKHPNPLFVLTASDCLVNITGSVSAEKISSVAAVLTKTDFINIAHAHVSNVNSPLRLDMWMCIANIANLCQDARNVLFQTSLFRVVPSPGGGGNSNPPFSSELALQDPATQPIILLVLFGLCADKESLINQPFVMAHWHQICSLLYNACPAPMRGEHNESLNMLILIISKILSKEKSSDEFCIRLLSIERPLISFLVKLCPRVEDIANQIRILQTLVHIGLQSVPQYEFQNIMREAGCIQMMSLYSQSPHDRIRREAMMWIGNYANECYEFVTHLLSVRAFDGITEYIQHPSEKSLMCQAIYVLSAASESCCRNKTEESNQVLKTFFGQNGWLRFTSQRVGRKGCNDLTFDILKLWVMLINWDKHFVRPILEETGGLAKVDELLADKDPRIWSAANALDELLQQNEEMEIN
jgi:hypothetical protein